VTISTLGDVHAVATSDQGRSRRWIVRHGRFTVALATVLVVLIGTNLARFVGPAGTGLVLGPVVAIGLVVLARRSGLSWEDLGLARRTWVRGAVYAAGAVGAVLACYGLAMALPALRSALLDSRYTLPPEPALVTALVVIPVGTVLLEEVAFRGVLQALITRHRGVRWGMGVSSTLFGVWHVLPSLGMTRSNPAIGEIGRASCRERV